VLLYYFKAKGDRIKAKGDRIKAKGDRIKAPHLITS